MKKFFINNFVEDLSHLRQNIRVCWLFFFGSGVGKKWDCLQKKNFLWSRKMTCDEAFQTYQKFVYLLDGVWKVSVRTKWGGNRRERFYSEMWGKAFWGGEGLVEIHVGLSIYDTTMETVECIWVNTWPILDSISSQNGKDRLPLHTVGKLVGSAKKWDIGVAGRDKMCENSNPLQCLAFDTTTWWNEDPIQ